MQVVTLQAQEEYKTVHRDTLPSSLPYIDGPDMICNSGRYTLYDIPSSATSLTWTISNNCLSIVSGQGTNHIIVEKHASGICEVGIAFNYGPLIMKAKTKVIVGTPSLGTSILFATSNNHQGEWASNMNNTFSIENDMSEAYERIEAKLYKLDNNFAPSQLVESWSNISTTSATIVGRAPGFYLFELRGVNDCGYSDWLSQEVEMVDFSNPHFILDYEFTSEMLTLVLSDSLSSSKLITKSNKTLPNAYEIQLWNSIGSDLMQSYKTNLTTYQVSLVNLPKGFYIIKIIKDGQTFSRKFAKK